MTWVSAKKKKVAKEGVQKRKVKKIQPILYTKEGFQKGLSRFSICFVYYKFED
jgi:hypothetical protein